MSLKLATVVKILESCEDLQKILVKLGTSSELVHAYNYRSFSRELVLGQEVLVNTTALDLNLGTGGVVFVVPGEPYENNPDSGHIVKLRYTPLQRAFESVEEQSSSFYERLKDAQSIEGMPVVCCELHSQMPLVAAALRHILPEAHISVIIHDGAALPLAFSQLLPQTKKAGLINEIISCGQAFGGDLEAINLYSALLATQKVCRAHSTIVAPGPGVVGSATLFGHSGVMQGEALNAVSVLKGSPIAPLRLSWQDARKRHRGLSHHSDTALGRVCLSQALVPVPADLSEQQAGEVREQLRASGIEQKHEVVSIKYPFSEIGTRGIDVTTMGRGRGEDPEFFSAAFAAGILAARVISNERKG